MEVGIKINQGENLADLVKTAKPIMEKLFGTIYGKAIDVHTRMVRENGKTVGAKVFADIPEPNGQSLDLITKLDNALYVPLVENALGTTGYDFVFGKKEIEDLFGYCAITRARVSVGDKVGAKAMTKEFLDKAKAYGLGYKLTGNT
jgi:hypothetical protein